MKKTVALICLLCISLLSFLGCSSKVSAPYASHSAENQFMELFERRAVRCGNFVYFYDYLAKNVTGVFVHEIGSDTAIPLCSKPECEHNDKNCTAHLTNSLGDRYNEITVYGDKLYLADAKGRTPMLYSVNLDGSGLEKVMALDGGYEQYYQEMDFLGIYKGTVYRCGYGAKVKEAETNKTMTLYSMPLGGEESTEILTVENMTQAIERISGNKLYCAVFTYNGDDAEEGKFFKFDLYCYDMDSAELEKLCTADVPDSANAVSVVGDKLFFSYGTIWSYSLSDGEIKNVMSDNAHMLYLSENRIMSPISKNECRIYDLEGNELATFTRKPKEFIDMPCVYSFVGSCDDVFYYIAEGEPDDPTEQYNLILAMDAKNYETKLLSAVFMGGRVIYKEDGTMVVDEGNGWEITQVRTTHYQGEP